MDQKNFTIYSLIPLFSNRCALGKLFGIRQMAYTKQNAVLCFYLTDSYHRETFCGSRVNNSTC